MTNAATFEAARRAIEKAGGLASRAQLAKHWGVSRQRVDQLAREVGFPAPVATDHTARKRETYLLGECDAWREARERARQR